MQRLDWNDLSYVLALHRSGSHASAARLLGVSDTTVARRLRVLERHLGGALFARAGQGAARLTGLGQRVLQHAEGMEREAIKLLDGLGGAGDQPRQSVTISAVPILTHKVLVPALATLQQDCPWLTVELVPDGRNYDLSKREADLALRFSRPDRGGLKVKARKLGSVRFDVFVAQGAVSEDAVPWILYSDGYATLPQARWMVAQDQGDNAAPLRVSDAETALEAVACGFGKSLLPTRIAARDPRLQRLDVVAARAMPERDVWLLSHEDQNDRRSVIAAKAWLADIQW